MTITVVVDRLITMITMLRLRGLVHGLFLPAGMAGEILIPRPGEIKGTDMRVETVEICMRREGEMLRGMLSLLGMFKFNLSTVQMMIIINIVADGKNEKLQLSLSGQSHLNVLLMNGMFK